MRHSAICAALALGFSATDVSAASVALFSGFSSNIDTALANGGHTITRVTEADVIGGALTGYDAFVYGRHYRHTVPVAFVNAVGAYLGGGGGLVTEWDGAAIVFSGYDSTYRYSPANPQLGLIGGTIGSGHVLAADTPITTTTPHPVMSGVASPYSAAHGTEFFLTSYGLNAAEVSTVATFTGDGSANFPAMDFAAVLVGESDNFVSIMFDLQDNPLDPNNQRLLNNAVDYVSGAAVVPLPLPASMLLMGLFGLGGLRRAA